MNKGGSNAHDRWGRGFSPGASVAPSKLAMLAREVKVVA